MSNKFLIISVFLGILVVMASLSFTALNINNVDPNSEESEIFEFSTFTTAVCEESEDSVFCKDEVFVNCNGVVSQAIDGSECGSIKVSVPKALGSAVFDKDWKDPRHLV